MLKEKSPESSKKVLIAVFGILVVGIGTYIALNGTELLQRFGANAYVPNPVLFQQNTEVKPSTNSTQMANDFIKISDIFPITLLKDQMTKEKVTTKRITNDFGANKGNVNYINVSMDLRLDSKAPNYVFPWLTFSTATKIHNAIDFHYDLAKPYEMINFGQQEPSGTYIKPSLLENNPANCNKAYLKKYSAQFNKPTGKYAGEEFWWPNLQPNHVYFPKRAGTYYISDAVCFVPFIARDSRPFEGMVDTRYDTTKNPADYAFQTGNYVMVLLNRSASTQYVIETLYFTDNSAAYNNFTKKYCVIKGAEDVLHCTRSSGGGYRGIDIMKNGRLYNLAGFEQMAFMPPKLSLAPQSTNVIVGGPYAMQWWTQTLGSKEKYWDFDNVDSAGTLVPHTVPQQATTWK